MLHFQTQRNVFKSETLSVFEQSVRFYSLLVANHLKLGIVIDRAAEDT